MKATANAPANIAFIKYWGKRDAVLNLPVNGSVSMNLSKFLTTTTVQFSQLKQDEIQLDGRVAAAEVRERIVRHLDRIRKIAGTTLRARVVSKNTFPTGVGVASSASGFAALTLAATRALGLRLSERRLSILARKGSGSACRSVPDGIVEWVAGEKDEDSYAYSLHSPGFWAIHDVVVLVSTQSKKVGSTAGHGLAQTSPFFRARLRALPRKLSFLQRALERRDFRTFGTIVEEEAFNMHAVMMTSVPPLLYWEPETLAVMHRVFQLRDEGLEAYVTLDAGPSVHVVCQEKDSDVFVRKLQSVKGVMDVIDNTPTIGARLVNRHLF